MLHYATAIMSPFVHSENITSPLLIRVKMFKILQERELATGFAPRTNPRQLILFSLFHQSYGQSFYSSPHNERPPVRI